MRATTFDYLYWLCRLAFPFTIYVLYQHAKKSFDWRPDLVAGTVDNPEEYKFRYQIELLNSDLVIASLSDDVRSFKTDYVQMF